MKNILATLFIFTVFFIGIILDSIVINTISNLFTLSVLLDVILKISLWCILSFLTGGIIIAISIIVGANIKIS